MDFNLPEKRKIKVSIYGTEYLLTKPSLGQAERLVGAIKAATIEGNELKVMLEFVALMGLPADKAREMDVDDFTALLEFLSGVKKK